MNICCSGFHAAGNSIFKMPLMVPPRTCQRGDPNRFCSGIPQRLCHSARGCPGREDVVYHQYVPALYGRWIRNFECPANIDAAHARRQSRLAFRGAKSNQRTRSERQPPFWIRPGQIIQRMHCQRSRLVEAALRLLRSVQRYRYDQHFCWRLAENAVDRFGQIPAKSRSCSVEPVVFERMKGFSNAPLVGPVTHYFYKRRRRQPACTALRGSFGNIRVLRCVDGVSAAYANTSRITWEFGPASIANWRGRKLRQERAA